MNNGKMIIDQSEYEQLIRDGRDLEIIRDAMKEYLDIFTDNGAPFVKAGFCSVLRIVFPLDFEQQLREARRKKYAEEWRNRMETEDPE